MICCVSDGLLNLVLFLSRDSGNLDATQLLALKEFLPSEEERKALAHYIETHDLSGEKKSSAWNSLSECEKYMAAMLQVTRPDAKFECMLFRDQVGHRLDDLMAAIEALAKACDQVRSSEKLRQLMAMILTVVNHINTGGSGALAAGFSLDALLKLNEVRKVGCTD